MNKDYKDMNREISSLLLFDDINITQVFDKGCWTYYKDGKWVVQLKLLKYQNSLEEYLDKKTISDVEKIDLVFKILTPIVKMHKMKICHFDFKDANVFMMNKYTPVIGDLGLTRTI